MRTDLNFSHEPTKIVAVGMSGCGKTRWANEFILRSRYDCYFVFDHDRQFSTRNQLKPAMSAAQILPQLKRGFVVFDPSEMFSDTKAALEWFARYAYLMSERLHGTKLFFCDELQDNVGTQTVSEFVRRVLVSGRNRGLDFLACSLQYNMIHNAIRGQATQTIAFKTEEATALKALTERGFKAEEITALRPGEFIQRNARDGSEVRGKVF